MLERAARCLKSGPLWPSSQGNHAVHSRRMLHSAFWHHGAGDLDIPAWCFHTMRALFEPECSARLGDNEKQQRREGPFLDFLYPEKTQAVIKRLSVYGLRRWHRHMRKLTNYAGLRCFMSSSSRGRAFAKEDNQVSTNVAEDTLAMEASGASNISLSSEEALQDLNILLKVHERREYQESWREAWSCYAAIDPASKTAELKHRLISLLASSPRSLDARRAVKLFETLSLEDRTLNVVPKALIALLKLKEFGKAVLIHAEAMQSAELNAPVEGTKILIASLLAERQWQLLFHTYDSCAKVFRSNQEALQSWAIELFESVLQMPRLTERVMNLLNAVSEHPYILSQSAYNSTEFLTSLVDFIFDHNVSFGVRQDWQVVKILKQLGLCPDSMYEKVAQLVLNSKVAPAKSRKENAYSIYKLWRQIPGFRPSKRILHNLLKVAVDTGDQRTVLDLLPDWHSHYGPLPVTLSGIVMKGFARAGDVAKVKRLMMDLVASHERMTWKAFYPALHVQALHGKPEAVQSEMARIKAEHDLEPDITCYNILLYAYQRSEDLDGTLSTLSALLHAGIEPDHYTVGTIMAVAADRGDVELCEQMLQLTRDRNMRRTTIMNDCMVLTYLNNYQPNIAELLAHTLSVHSRDAVSTRAWNQILSYYSISDRPRNLRSTLRVARHMQKLRIPYDSMSYAAIMRAYVVKRRTDMARRILHKVLLGKGLPVLPIHYAIVIDGYANQLNTEKGLRIQAEMLKRGVKPSLSTKLAMQKLHATAANRKFLIDQAVHPGIRLDVLDESLEESLQTHEPTVIADRSPQLQSSRFRPTDVYPAAYFDLSLAFYGKIRAFDVVKALVEKYETTSDNATIPLRFLATLMNLHYRESAHEEVDRYWTLAKDAALKSAKVAATFRGDTRLPPVRRTVLARHLDILLRSLDARGGPDHPTHILAAINDLYALGFDLDNANWNLYVQLLATRGSHLTAFRLCETNLMANFPNWQEDEARVQYFQATAQKSRGTEFLGKRYTYLKPGELRATYKTMVRFALVLRKLRRAAPFDRGMAEQLVTLQKEAPRTVKAVLEMPTLEHPIATHILGLKAVQGARRRLPL